MTETKPFIVLNFDGKEYKYRMTLNSIIELQEKAKVNLENSEELARKLQSDFKLIRTIIWLGIRTYNKDITEAEVGDLIDMANFEEVLQKVLIHMGMIDDSETSKNVQRAVRKKTVKRGTGTSPSKRHAKSESSRKSSTN